MKFTKRNHYNPCFWTALWNEDYYNKVAKNITHLLPLRDHLVYALNVKSGQIHKLKVEKVHYSIVNPLVETVEKVIILNFRICNILILLIRIFVNLQKMGFFDNLVECQWTLYTSDANIFPLCDSAILVKPHSVLVALSPRLLLEIERTLPAGDSKCHLKQKINKAKYDEFRQRTIGNTFR